VRNAAWSVGALALGAGIVLAGQAMLASLQQREATLQRIVAQERTYQTLRPEIRALMQQQVSVEQRLAQLRELGWRRMLVSEAMQRVAEALPDDAWLVTLDLAKEDRELTALLEGYARSFESVTRLMDQLKSAVGWSKVKPLATTVHTDAEGKEQILFAVTSQQPLPQVGASNDDDAEADPEPRAGKSTRERRPSSGSGKARGSDR
jgi:Tfp pilus assembly protein PilN